MNLVKNSFTLLETLISITLLSIVISGFFYSSYHDENHYKNYVLLNDLENRFDTKNYSNFSKINQNIQIIKNKNTIEDITVSNYIFENEDIKIFKYEK